MTNEGLNKMRRTMSVYVIAIGAGTLLAGALACGPASSGGGGAPTEAPATQEQNNHASDSTMPTIEPCSILTQDDAAAFFGVQTGAGDGSVGATTAQCDYRNPNDGDGLVLILVYAPDGALKSDAFTYMTKGAQAVPGLGEGAFYIEGGNLDVAKGNWIMTLTGAMGGKNVGLDKLTPVATAAVARLP